jgi:hypothetical protein
MVSGVSIEHRYRAILKIVTHDWVSSSFALTRFDPMAKSITKLSMGAFHEYHAIGSESKGWATGSDKKPAP